MTGYGSHGAMSLYFFFFNKKIHFTVLFVWINQMYFSFFLRLTKKFWSNESKNKNDWFSKFWIIHIWHNFYTCKKHRKNDNLPLPSCLLKEKINIAAIYPPRTKLHLVKKRKKIFNKDKCSFTCFEMCVNRCAHAMPRQSQQYRRHQPWARVMQRQRQQLQPAAIAAWSS